MKRSFGIELLIITVIGLIYFVLHAPALPTTDYSPPALDLNPIVSLLSNTSVRPLGTEHERLAGVILPIQVGLQRYGHIPSWNSYLSNGVPLINNAFNYLFNPFHSLPILLLGGVTGSKLATIIAILIAGYSMWMFGLAIGLGGKVKGDDVEYDIDFNNETSVTDPDFTIKRFDAGANLLAGYEFSNNLSFQLNAGLGLTRLNNRPDNDNNSSIKNTGFGVSLGYRFGR